MRDEAAEGAAGEFERVGDDVGEGLGLGAAQNYVDYGGDDSDQCAVDDETRLDAAADPEGSEEAEEERSGRGGVDEEVAAEMQAERDDCEDEGDFGEEAA